MNSCAGDLLRYRKQIGADNIKIFTDIKKKHWCVDINLKSISLRVMSPDEAIHRQPVPGNLQEENRFTFE